jgi:hypothetical protein
MLAAAMVDIVVTSGLQSPLTLNNPASPPPHLTMDNNNNPAIGKVTQDGMDTLPQHALAFQPSLPRIRP